MTSENSSLIRNRALQRQILRRRLWLTALTWLCLLLLYPAALITRLAGLIQGAGEEYLAAQAARNNILVLVSSWIGLRQPLAILAVLFGAIFAIQGFSWLFSQEKTDFYESQPVGRMQRFWAIFWNGIFLYEIPLFVSLFLSALGAAAMGAMDEILWQEVGWSFLQLSLLFLTSYAVGLLAVMLTGHLVVSMLMTAFLLSFDWIWGNILSAYASVFFKTVYSLGTGPAFLLSPLYNSGIIRRRLSQGWSSTEGTRMTADLLKKFLVLLGTPDLLMAALFAGCLILAALLYRSRRAESAGSAVLYAPARFFVRVAVGLAAGLYAGQLVFSAFSGVSALSDVVMIFAILTAVILAAGFAQVVFSFDFRRFFRGTWQIALTGILAVFVFCIYRYDLTGYDRYVPDREQVKSCAIYVYTENYDGLLGTEGDTDILTEKVLDQMALEDTDKFTRLASDAMKYRREAADSASGGFEAVIRYRLWDGKTVTRTVTIPKEEDPKILDAIVGSSAWHSVLFPENWEATIPRKCTFSVTNGAAVAAGDRSQAVGFAAAYREDLKQYTYSMAASQYPILLVEIAGGDYTEQFAVYPSYEKTLAFLQESGLYLPPVTDRDITRVEVDCTGGEVYRQTAYTDREKIRKIFAGCTPAALLGSWKDYSDYDMDYLANASVRDAASPFTLYFEKNSVPDFVQKDLQGD